MGQVKVSKFISNAAQGGKAKTSSIDKDFRNESCSQARIFVISAATSFLAIAGEPVPKEPPDRPKTVGNFYCSDCEMDLGPVGPDTTILIKTVVDTFAGTTWLTPDGEDKYFINCNASACVKIECVDAGTWVVTFVFPNLGNLKFKAIGSSEGGATPPPHNGGNGGGGGGNGGGATAYWMGDPREIVCYDYYSDGVFEGENCSEAP